MENPKESTGKNKGRGRWRKRGKKEGRETLLEQVSGVIS